MADLVLTILAVRDLDAAVAFYRQAFGWPVRVSTAVYVELGLADGRGLGLYLRTAFASNTGVLPAEPAGEGTITATELYLRCADLEASIQRLEAAGARLLSARAARSWGDEAAYYADPDGNVVVLARPSASSEA